MSPRTQTALAGALGLAGGAFFGAQLSPQASRAAWIPSASLALAAGLALSPRLGPQLLARGVWWSNLVLGALLCGVGSRAEAHLGVALTLGCAGALLLAGGRSLAAAGRSAGFRPESYGGTIMLLLVLALGDAQTLGLLALIERSRPGPSAPALALAAAGFAAGAVGLARLSYVGLLATTASALALVVALAAGVVAVDPVLRIPLYAIAGAQLAAPLPMLASIATRRPLPSLSPGAASLAARACVAAIGLCALALAARR